MNIVRAIIAGFFVFMAFGIFVRYMTVRRWGLLLGAVIYGTAGVLTLMLGAWWPLLAGFALAWIVGKAGADPPTDLRLDLPTIERGDSSDDTRVREYLRWWLENDEQARLVKARFIEEAWERNLRRPAFLPGDESWAASSAEEAWSQQTRDDLRRLVTASRHDFRDELDNLAALSRKTLLATGEIMIKYDLPSLLTDFDTASKKIPDSGVLTAYAEHYVADAILSARLRVLAWTYQYWHGERYELPHKRDRVGR